MARSVYKQNMEKLYANPTRKPAESSEVNRAKKITDMFFPSMYDTNPDVQKLKKKLYARIPKS